MQHVTVRNKSNGLVLVGDEYLYPGTARSVPVSYYETADKAYPGALVIETNEEPVPGPAVRGPKPQPEPIVEVAVIEDIVVDAKEDEQEEKQAKPTRRRRNKNA